MCAYTLLLIGALSAVYSFFFFANKFKISPRRDSNSRTNTSSLRGLPLLIVHRGDLLSIHPCTLFDHRSAKKKPPKSSPISHFAVRCRWELYEEERGKQSLNLVRSMIRPVFVVRQQGKCDVCSSYFSFYTRRHPTPCPC